MVQREAVRVRVRLFASLRESVGQGELELELPEGSTPDEVWRRIAADHPELGGRRGRLAAAVNRRYASFDEPLSAGDEVVFIPPVSGG
jgi:molybdopterin converting factor subunit 1